MRRWSARPTAPGAPTPSPMASWRVSMPDLGIARLLPEKICRRCPPCCVTCGPMASWSTLKSSRRRAGNGRPVRPSPSMSRISGKRTSRCHCSRHSVKRPCRRPAKWLPVYLGHTFSISCRQIGWIDWRGSIASHSMSIIANCPRASSPGRTKPGSECFVIR